MSSPPLQELRPNPVLMKMSAGTNARKPNLVQYIAFLKTLFFILCLDLLKDSLFLCSFFFKPKIRCGKAFYFCEKFRYQVLAVGYEETCLMGNSVEMSTLWSKMKIDFGHQTLFFPCRKMVRGKNSI